ncbi:MAG: hypothetical protein V4733_09100 [Verrucomicrobiota bacterium]
MKTATAISLLLVSVIHGGEITVIRAPFSVVRSFSVTIVVHPEGNQERAVARFKQPDVRALKPGAEGCLLLPGREDARIAAKVETVEVAPDEDTATVVLSTAKTDDVVLRPGMTATAMIITHHNNDAISLPKAAVSLHPQGWCVEVKRADGKKELRIVHRGRETNDKVEILSGLEPGQVVIVP